MKHLIQPSPNKAAAGFMDVVMLQDTLFHRAAYKFTQNERFCTRIATIGFDFKTASQIKRSLRIIRDVYFKEPADISVLAPSGQCTFSATDVIVNLDAFIDIETAVTGLLDFRVRNKSSAVIAVTSSVKSDDFGSERSQICDVTLRSPLSDNRILAAFLAIKSGAVAQIG